MPAFVRQSSVLSQLVHWWAVGLELARRRIRPPVEIESGNLVFSSVLRESLRSPSAPGMDDPASEEARSSVPLPLRPEANVEVLTSAPPVRRPLRTAEQARASLKFRFCKSSYEEPTVDALAPRTDEGRE